MLSKRPYYILFLLCLLLSFSNCKMDTKNAKKNTYFGGEIIRPNTNYILLSRDNKKEDTIYLDKNNQFLHRIDNLEKGIVYSFKHKPEAQAVLIEPGDSILVRLNTIEFDESLVFSGKGSKKNNFLINTYLRHESERKKINRKYFKLPPKEFKKNYDSLYGVLNKTYESFINKNDISDFAKKICKANIDYEFYTWKEIYHFQYVFYENSRIKIFDEPLTKNFLNHRKGIDLNDEDLKMIHAYNKFLNQYINNIAYTSNNNNFQLENSLFNTLYKFQLVDSLIKNTYTKNSLLRHFAIKSIVNSSNISDSRKILSKYLSISDNKEFQREMTRITNATSKLMKDNILPDQEIISYNKEETKLSTLFSKPINVIYFWSLENRNQFVKSHKKMDSFKEKFPNIDFISINIDEDKTDLWANTVRRHNFDLDKEFKFKSAKCSIDELIIHRKNKVIIVDDMGKIIIADGVLFSNNLKRKLEIFDKNLLQ